MMTGKHSLLSPPLRFGGAAFLLSLFGVLTIISSQSAAPQPLYLALRQSGGIVAGFIIFFFASRVPFGWYRRYALLLAVVGVVLLFLLPF